MKKNDFVMSDGMCVIENSPWCEKTSHTPNINKLVYFLNVKYPPLYKEKSILITVKNQNQ